jgi:UDP-N-acetylmuramoylalanine--D-glutamate ligase
MKEKVVILGAGESGTGAALLAKAKGFDLFVSDSGIIKDKYKSELIANNIPFEEGVHTAERILDASLLIKSPGISDKAPILQKVAALNIPVIDEIEFAFRHTEAKIIAVTGTNGKTTTTLLAYHLMKQSGLHVGLAGNVGVSMARQVAQQNFDWFVLEISSYQLDGTEAFKPEVGILLNITPDHLDRYDNTMQNYVNAKFQLIENMTRQEYFIFYQDDAVIAKEMKTRSVVPHRIPVSLNADTGALVFADATTMHFNFKDKFTIAQTDTTLKGPHNLINTMAAVAAVYHAGGSLEAIRAGLRTFVNAPHRLEPVGNIRGVEFINDSKATNVDSVVYALGSFDRPLIWVAGGIDKGNDYNLIKEQVRKKVRALICLGKENDKLKKAFGDVVPVIKETQSVRELVRISLELAREGDVVLLSPACASFDLFNNYEDRGDQFRAAVKEFEKV